MAKGGGTGMESIKQAENVFIALLTLGLVGLLFLIIYGNLSGNLGFAANSQGANDTNAVINNLTSGATTFFTFSNVWFVLTAITVLIAIVIGVIVLVRRTSGTGGSFSN